MPDATVNGVRLAYERHGEGEPVLLVPGLGQPAFTWRLGVGPLLEHDGWQPITFDQRGMPPSACPPAPYSVAQLAADAAGLIEQLDLAPCRMAGYSLGSWVVEELACTRPELVRAAALVAGCNPSTAWERAEAEYGRDLAALGVALPRLQDAMELLRYLPPVAIQDDVTVRNWLTMLGGASEPWENPGRRGQWEAAVAWTHDETRAACRESIRAPVLVLAFEHDIDCPPARAREAAARIPGARYAEISGTGHLGVFERAGEVVEALGSFFRSPEAGAR